MELFCLLHQAQRLAVALGIRRAEPALQALTCSMTLFNGNDSDRLLAKICHTRDNCCVVCEAAVAMQLKKISKDAGNEIRAGRAFAAARNFYALIG